jgi:hypothetical protein
LVDWLARKTHTRRGAARPTDYSRLYWTPPLSAHQAFDLERSQIETVLGCRPMIALSDHDSIDAPLALQVLEETRATPISLEWTVPFRATFFHFGVYNLPPAHSAAWIRRMADFTANPDELQLRDLLAGLTQSRQTLVVVNHPVWDEKGVGQPVHDVHLIELLGVTRGFVHGLEINGFRPAWENRRAAALARGIGLPLIGGGDRHGKEPNSILNLTNAATFAEYVHEVRFARRNHVLLMPQYNECRRTRIVQSICDILSDDAHHALGWRRWEDRVFYRADDGSVLPLAEIWSVRKQPAMVRSFVQLIRFTEMTLKHKQGRSAVRMALNFRRSQGAA